MGYEKSILQNYKLIGSLNHGFIKVKLSISIVGTLKIPLFGREYTYNVQIWEMEEFLSAEKQTVVENSA